MTPNNNQDKYDSWLMDQITKSEFFHQKLHEYKLLELWDTIERVPGENLAWNKKDLGISEQAWKRIIHQGIKPLRVFAHPYVLVNIPRSVGYYQKLAMVSLKSMSNIGLPITRYESGQNKRPMEQQRAQDVARHLNTLTSRLIESDDVLDPREFDLWRGMTAGSSAQGSWQNKKGQRTEEIIRGLVTRRIQNKKLLVEQSKDNRTIQLQDGRIVEYGSEPDIAFYDQSHKILIAVEIKGGIDMAGVLERIGAVIKSLSRAKQENPNSITILVMPKVSMTEQAEQELKTHQSTIDHWFTIEDMINRNNTKKFFEILDI